MGKDGTEGYDKKSNSNQEAIRRVSKGQLKLETIIRSLLPLETLETEHGVGERLRLDIFYPKYKLGFEYHGRQHYEYVEHFHNDIYGFQESLERDKRKIELCNEQGIVLIVFKYDEALNEALVFDRLKDAIETTKVVSPLTLHKKKWQKIDKTHPLHRAQLLEQKKYRREAYQRMKEYKKNIDGR